MPLHLDNAQFNAFVSFAQNAKDVNSVAGESEPAGPRAGLRRHGSGSRPRGRTRGLPERGNAASSAFKDMLDGLRTIGNDRFGLEEGLAPDVGREAKKGYLFPAVSCMMQSTSIFSFR